MPSWFWAELSVIRLFWPFTATMIYLYSSNEINLCFHNYTFYKSSVFFTLISLKYTLI